MDELKRDLESQGLGFFTPIFDGELKDLGNGAWFIGWECAGPGGETLLTEARFGKDSAMKKWRSNPDDPSDETDLLIVKMQRDRFEKIMLTHMGALVVAEINEGQTPALHDLPAVQDFEKIEFRVDKKGNPITPPQQLVADHLLQGFGDNFTRDSEDPFYWQDTHWQGRNPKNFKRYLYSMAQALRLGDAKQHELVSIAELFMNQAPALSDNQTFYQQNPHLANFLDGTLEVIKNPDGTYRKEFREHRHEDLLTWVLPYHYKAPRRRNTAFEEWLGKAFSDDPDGAGKIRALKQIGGACLISLFPRICFLVSNQGGTGKSTFAKLCMRFMGQGNYSSLAPHLMEGFHMESMIGKQANIVTDIGKKAVVSEDFMKLVEDGLPILVNRKGRPAVQARIPALHLFCANKLPRGIDGESNAMDRRVTIVEFTKSMLGDNQEAYTRDYEEVLLKAGPGAILDFFEDGLDDLLQSGGIYFNPESGKDALRQWKDSESLTAQFIEALIHGEVGPTNAPFVVDPNGKVLRSKLSAALNDWSGKVLPNQQISRMFTELEGRGFPKMESMGVRYVKGIRGTGLFG